MPPRPALAFAFVFAVGLAACGGGRPDHLATEDDLSDAAWSLVDQDSAAFAFPADLAGRPAYVTAV